MFNNLINKIFIKKYNIIKKITIINNSIKIILKKTNFQLYFKN